MIYQKNMSQNLINKYFFVLFSIIPISIIAGPSVSLANILIIVLSFLIYMFFIKEWTWLKDKKIKLLIILYLYLIFNSFIALDFSSSFYRNFGFVRFIVLFAAFNYFFLKFKNFEKIFFVWFIILFFLSLDMYYESINGKNIFGYGEGDRIFSFFKDEPVAGGFLYSLYLLPIAFLYNFYEGKDNFKFLIFILSLFFLVSILITGERSNTIKSFFVFFMFYIFAKNFSNKEKITSLFLMILLLSGIFLNSNFLKMRYVDQLLIHFKSKDRIVSYFSEGYFNKGGVQTNVYGKLYISGIEVFKKKPYFGVGNKNYGFETCWGDKGDTYLCSSHPHQIYFEFLAEHGFIGTVIILSIFFKLFFDLLKKININKNKIQFASFLYVLIVFMPVLPGGAFFSDNLLTLFFINFSLLFCSNKASNIFYKK